jgi:Ner family transcriptional regulator
MWLTHFLRPKCDTPVALRRAPGHSIKFMNHMDLSSDPSARPISESATHETGSFVLTRPTYWPMLSRMRKIDPRPSPPADWHPADVIAALHKVGLSLRRLSSACGYSPHTLRHALRHFYPRAEQLIADALGLAPSDIWPSRYVDDGTNNQRTGRPRNRISTNDSSVYPTRNADKEET